MRVLKVSAQEEGQRLDRMLAKYMQLAPRRLRFIWQTKPLRASESRLLRRLREQRILEESL